MALVALGALLLTLPWWLGLALRPVLQSQGITFEAYERAGYAHFLLRNVNHQAARFRLDAAQVKSVTPLLWLARRLRGQEPALAVENWSARLIPATPAAGTKSAPNAIQGMPGLQLALQQIGPHLVRWLPQADLKTGTISGLGPELKIAAATWRKGTLKVEGLRVTEHELAVVLIFAADGSASLVARTAGNEARLQLAWTGTTLTGEATLWEQPVQLTARFPTQGWLPAEAGASAANWQLPARRAGLGSPYAQVVGGVRLDWRDGRFDLSLNASAQPEAQTKAPPFSARVAAHGTLKEFVLTAFDVDAPFAKATLTAPVTFGVDRPLAAESAQLNVAADLAKLPWLEARGLVKGTIRVNGDTAAARQTFQLQFTDVMLPGFALQQAKAEGVLHWPELELTTLAVQLDAASSLQASGTINWQSRELHGANLAATLGSAWFTRWLPSGMTWGAAKISATAEGSLDAPRHQGTLQFTEVQRPPLRPLRIDASWQGVGAQTEILSARVTAQPSALDFAGHLDAHGLQLTRFLHTINDQAVWSLTSPTRLTWAPGWNLDPLQLSGPAGRLTLKGTGGSEGFFELAVADFDSAWLQDWVTIAGPAWRVDTLQATGRGADQILIFDTALSAQIVMTPRPAQVKLVASGDAQGVHLKELSVVEGDRALTQATGRWPLIFRLQPTLHLQWDETLPLELAASTAAASPLWAALSAATGLTLKEPVATMKLTGTLRQPVGDLQLRASQLSLPVKSESYSPPEGTDLTLDLQFSRERVTLANFSAKLDGQAVRASGQIEMNDARWRQLWREPAAFDWSEAGGKLEIPDADLAPLAHRAPHFIAALGRLRARIELSPGRKFSGELYLTDAASRPLPPFGTLQQINADLTLDDHTLTVRSLSAKLGGEPVVLDGSLTLVPGAAPRLALGLKGTNLPLVRNTGLILRNDLDVRATTDPAGVTRLTGTITLRDSLVLANLNDLLPTGPRGVTRQPPYFAVAAEPYRHWPLDITVRGPRAIRIRTTVFNGTASPRFHLGGTLGEPRAVGELTVDQGQVLFPFASFKVRQGIVRLSEADPFHAKVNLNATSQRRDYQLRLEVTGQLPTPIITLSSAPALAAEDVLLMVMTGQPPSGETASSGAQRLGLLGVYLGRGIFQDLGLGGEDRLEISAGQQVSQQGRETYEFEYKLGEKWSLVGEYDRFDQYNTGLKWRVYTQESTPREEK
jgi:translocation and assembly module TamB